MKGSQGWDSIIPARGSQGVMIVLTSRDQGRKIVRNSYVIKLKVVINACYTHNKKVARIRSIKAPT